MNSLFNQHQTVYSLDASSLIEAHHSYPMEIFPSFPSDKRVAGQSTFEYISDLETATRGVMPQRL